MTHDEPDDLETQYSRIGPPPVPAVEFEGRVYFQIANGRPEGLAQRTGYLAVNDAGTGRRVATVRAYEVAFDPGLEADVQDVFFTRLELQAGARRLLVENEQGGRFHVAVDDLAVSRADRLEDPAA